MTRWKQVATRLSVNQSRLSPGFLEEPVWPTTRRLAGHCIASRCYARKRQAKEGSLLTMAMQWMVKLQSSTLLGPPLTPLRHRCFHLHAYLTSGKPPFWCYPLVLFHLPVTLTPPSTGRLKTTLLFVVCLTDLTHRTLRRQKLLSYLISLSAVQIAPITKRVLASLLVLVPGTPRPRLLSPSRYWPLSLPTPSPRSQVQSITSSRSRSRSPQLQEQHRQRRLGTGADEYSTAQHSNSGSLLGGRGPMVEQPKSLFFAQSNLEHLTCMPQLPRLLLLFC